MNKLNFIQQLKNKHHIHSKGIIIASINEQYEIINQNKTNILFLQPHPLLEKKMQAEFKSNHLIKIKQKMISQDALSLPLYHSSVHHHSSASPYKKYQEFYPNIKETEQSQISALPLEQLFNSENFIPENYNILFIDMHGGEWSSIEGSKSCFIYLDAIIIAAYQTEVFEDVVGNEELDNFMQTVFWKQAAIFQDNCPFKSFILYIPDPLAKEKANKNIKLQNDILALKRQTEQLETDKKDTQNSLNQANICITQLNADIDNSAINLQKTNKCLKDAQKLIAKLKQDKEDIKSELEKASTRFSQSENTLKLLEIQFDDLLSDHIACNYQLQQLKKEITNSDEMIDNTRYGDNSHS